MPCDLRTIVNILSFSLILASCSSTIENEPVPNYILPEATMKKVMTDVLLIEGARTGNKILGDTTTLASYYHLVWEKYQITEEEFDTSFTWYTLHPKMASKMYGEIIIDLQKMEVDIQQKTREETPTDIQEKIKAAVTEGLEERTEKSPVQKNLRTGK